MKIHPSPKQVKKMLGSLFNYRYNENSNIYIILDVTLEREGTLIKAAPVNDLEEWMTFSLESFNKYCKYIE